MSGSRVAKSIGRDFALAVLSALLMIGALPGLDLGALAWISLVPLLVALEGKNPRQAYVLSYVAGVVYFESLFYWIWTVPGWNVVDSLLVHVIYLPQYVAVWGLALNWIRKRTSLATALVAPPLWVTAEYLRSETSFLSLPWMFLGHSQYSHPPLIQISSVTGVYGLSFLIVLTNAAIADVVIHFCVRLSRPSSSLVLPKTAMLSLAGAGCLLVASVVYGVSILSRGLGDERTTVAVIQGNIPQGKRWDKTSRQTILSRHHDLTLDAVRRAPQLIVWPETAVPGDVQHDPQLKRKVSQIAVETKTHLLVGSSEYAKFTDRQLQNNYQNSMVFFSPEGEIAGQYRKIALIPFAEYVPLRNLVTWPKAIVASSMGDFVPGDQYTLFSAGTVPFASVICWEIIFPDLFRQFVKRGAAFMVVATNEAWFGDTSAPRQLLIMSAFRAAENRVAIARAANTGISAFIDPFGRVTDRLRGRDGQELFVQGVLIGDLPISRDRTFYTRHGDIFAFLQIGVVGIMVVLGVRARRLGSRARRREGET